MVENSDHKELVAKITHVAAEVGDIKISLERVNGKIDALTARQADTWANVLDRIAFSERAAQQAALSLTDRINVEVKRADERHVDLEDEIEGVAARLDRRIDTLRVEDITPLKTEAETNAAWRNKVIGWAAGASFVAGIVGSLLVKFLL